MNEFTHLNFLQQLLNYIDLKLQFRGKKLIGIGQ